MTDADLAKRVAEIEMEVSVMSSYEQMVQTLSQRLAACEREVAELEGCREQSIVRGNDVIRLGREVVELRRERDLARAQALAQHDAYEAERDALRARVAESAQAVADGLEDHAKAMAEIERLRARVADFQQIATNAVKEQGRLGTKLAAIEHNIWERQDAADREIERLRAGLREILHFAHNNAPYSTLELMRRTARRLLGDPS